MEHTLIQWIHTLSGWMEKIKWKQIFAVFAVLMLTGSVVLGICTRVSYDKRSQDPTTYDNAPLQFINTDSSVDAESAFRAMKKSSHIMVVELRSSKQAYMDTESTVQVQQVLKGENVQPGDQITIFEKLSFSFDGASFSYRNYAYSNRMLPGERYLVFVSERELDPAYKERLPRLQFLPDDVVFVPFLKICPLQTTCLTADPAPKYGDVKNAEFLCFDQATLDALNQLKELAFHEYGLSLE